MVIKLVVLLNARSLLLFLLFFLEIVQSAYGIIFPIVMSEGVRQMFFPITIAAYNRGSAVVMKSAMFDMMA